MSASQTTPHTSPVTGNFHDYYSCNVNIDVNTYVPGSREEY
jgi:hypothetical protein